MTSNKLTVLITGASTGIGFASAKLLQQKGMQVFAGFRSVEDGERLREIGCEPVVLDVTDHDSIKAAIDIVTNSCPNGLDYLVNNAGLATAAPLEYIPMEDFRHQMAVNVDGVLAVYQAALPLLRMRVGAQKTPPRIINVSSVSGLISYPALGAYCASKFALEALSDSMRMELLPHGIDVCVVQPGPVKTPIWKRSTGAGRKRMEQMGAKAEQNYGQLMNAMMQGAEDSERHGVTALAVAEVIYESLIARKPKTRTIVGNGIKKMLWIARLLGDRQRDRLFMKKLGCV